MTTAPAVTLSPELGERMRAAATECCRVLRAALTAIAAVARRVIAQLQEARAAWRRGRRRAQRRELRRDQTALGAPRDRSRTDRARLLAVTRRQQRQLKYMTNASNNMVLPTQGGGSTPMRSAGVAVRRGPLSVSVRVLNSHARGG